MVRNVLALTAASLFFIACESNTKKLPIIGDRDTV
jgi:hypothetical protein